MYHYGSQMALPSAVRTAVVAASLVSINAVFAQPNPLKNAYFGEQHMHTDASPDAFVVGTRGTWDDAYRWAKGEEITLSTTGQKIRKSHPMTSSPLLTTLNTSA